MNELLGYFGIVCTLTSVLSCNSRQNFFRGMYNPLVIVGGISLAINSYLLGATHFVILNIVFVALGSYGMVMEYVNWRRHATTEV